MSLKPISIAFVSGKGGVGKTMLAANFAWVCSQIVKTALIDLDFQNQGCTGLFAPLIELGQGNVLEAIENTGTNASQELNQVAEMLYFLPAVCWQRGLSQKEITHYVNAADFQHKLATFIRQLKLRQSFEVVILDCHGGVDAVSLATFQSCDYTLMVTEADSVTFAGTLELLNYYETSSSETSSIVTPDEPPSQSQKVSNGTNRIESSPNVKFIVNRLPSKYRWKDLEKIYKRYISKKLGIFTQDRSIFCYIPSEELLADSFGEYPFHVKLASKSIFSKKINYMVYSLLNGIYDIPSHYKPLTKFRKRRYMRKIERVVVSNEFKNTSTILKFYAWFSTLFAIVLIGSITILTLGAFLGFEPDVYAILRQRPYLTLLFGAAMLGPIFWYSFKAMLGLMFFYRDKHKFQKALFRSVNPILTLWQRLSLAKLLLLRIGTSFILYFLILWLALLLVGILE